MFLSKTSKQRPLFGLLLSKLYSHYEAFNSLDESSDIYCSVSLRALVYLAGMAVLRATSAAMLLIVRKLSRSRSSSSIVIPNSF